MRIIPAILAAALTLLVGGKASAIEYPWCAEYSARGGATNCGFSTIEQCRATVSGIGGFCRENLFYTAAVVQPEVVRPRPHKKRVHH
jgi:hypothetical protein